ncbi:MAG: hypothetical protein JJE04_03300 [Acidobacteriia bacterium]|nr:hypothetical protein [Terriglobia bacterium]
MSKKVEQVAKVAALLVCALAVRHAVRLAVADAWMGKGTIAVARRALDWDAANGRNWEQLAGLQEADGGDGREALRRAAEVNPREAGIWMRLGLSEEMAGDTERAEEYLLRASRLSNKYAAKWTLASYYFRRGDTERFWQWAREALAMSYGDRTALFDLCWRVAADGDEIVRRAIPERGTVRVAFGQYLLNKFADGPELLAAVRVWGQLDVERGAFVTNGDFSRASMGTRLDWRVSEPEGITVEQGVIVLRGNQPEDCEVLSQTVPVQGGVGYVVKVRYRAHQPPGAVPASDTGLEWRIGGEAVRMPVQGSLVQVRFRGKADGAARLVLAHRRLPGHTRAEVEVRLEEVTSELEK